MLLRTVFLYSKGTRLRYEAFDILTGVDMKVVDQTTRCHVVEDRDRNKYLTCVVVVVSVLSTGDLP